MLKFILCWKTQRNHSILLNQLSLYKYLPIWLFFSLFSLLSPLYRHQQCPRSLQNHFLFYQRFSQWSFLINNNLFMSVYFFTLMLRRKKWEKKWVRIKSGDSPYNNNFVCLMHAYDVTYMWCVCLCLEWDEWVFVWASESLLSDSLLAVRKQIFKQTSYMWSFDSYTYIDKIPKKLWNCT